MTLRRGIDRLGVDWRPYAEALMDHSEPARRYLLRSGAAYETRLRWDAVPYPHYGYGLLQAALQARGLQIPAVSAVEFGVAGGSGLVALEEHAVAIEALTGVAVRTFGFDTGEGLPMATDHRDLPYIWRPGYFKMDVPALHARLRRSELILGDVRETVPRFRGRDDVPPLAFISFDLDYYSSTRAAMEVLDGPEAHRIPRVFCHFDDIIGIDAELHSPFAGQLLAIEEHNAANEHRKLALINGLRHKRRLPRAWNDQLYVLHDFRHPSYSVHLGPEAWDVAPHA
jgi:hypothetical protein